MINLKVSESLDQFREEFRSWYRATKSTLEQVEEKGSNALEKFIFKGRLWQSELAKARFVGVHWPEKFGGRNLSLLEEAVIQEELVRVGAPQLLGLFGLTMVGPVLIRHGTEDQKSRFLPGILNATDIWCQGFSETEAGSDLAALRTRAEPASGGFVLSGQKIWTSFAHIASYCFVLCRTSNAAVKHEGLSYLLVDMKSSGISVRPLKQASGDEEFNEVFFDKVFVPSQNLVGSIGDGWKIAITTLMYERVVLTFARQLQSETALRGLLREFLQNSNFQDYCRDFANHIATACAVRALSYKHLSAYAAGTKPGPEGSIDKLLWSESFQKLSSFALELRAGQAALNEKGSDDVHRYLYSRGRTIAAGTSEIQKNIIAERILKLPRPEIAVGK